MKYNRYLSILAITAVSIITTASSVNADTLSLTSGNNATTTPSVATSITGFQVIGNVASTTPVQLRVTNGSLSMTTTSGLTFDGASSGSQVNFSGTVANINAALATLKYTRGSTGTDTLEVSLVNKGEVFFLTNNHLYKFVAGSYTWDQARAAASSSSAYGAQGYLATITSLAENNFVYTRITGDGWLGTTDTDTEKTWKWMTGPEAGLSYFQENPSGGGGSPISGRYHGWASGEPNDFGAGEDCGYMYSSQGGEWNDYPCSTPQGYVAEFGAPGNLPTVVATNISIVTADVPAITTLSPANAATNVSTTANLVITFSKTVYKNSGNIVIRKVSDDSITETIVVSGSNVTGSTSTTITINPDSTLEENTQYYVTLPSNGFRDGSNNYFDGISASTTWRFTTGDFTAPIISAVATSSLASTTATITWTTNEIASSRIAYGFTTTYSTTTTETDTSPRVTSHSRGLTNLLPCTTYHYTVVSRDGATNTASSSDMTFTTAGCVASIVPSVATSTSITSASGGTTTIQTSGKTFSAVAPAGVTSTSSSLVIQIQAIEKTPVIEELGAPTSLPNSVGTIVFDVKAIINGTTILDSFAQPVTITYNYSDSDVNTFIESSLKLYHYHNGAWDALSDCTVDTVANMITCTTQSFSIFGLFGTLQQVTSTTVGGASGFVYGCKDKAALNYDSFASQHRQILCTYPTALAQATPVSTSTVIEVSAVAAKPISLTVCAPYINSYIRLGAKNNEDDVRKLEIFLNEKQGEKLVVDGVYSKGDAEAVKRFQEKYKSEVLTIWGLSAPTGYVYRTTLMKINSFYCSATISCPFFKEYNSTTENNQSQEVLQTKTLLTELGFYTGTIDATFDANLRSSLKNFQMTFKESMLTPWGLTSGTGYKYKTTNKFLNMVVGCKTDAVELDGKGKFDF